MSRVKSAVKQRREYIKELLLGYVPDRTIARKCADKFNTNTATIFSDLRIIKKQMSEDAARLADAEFVDRLKMQHVSSLQRAMATAISKDNINQFIRASAQYIQLMDFNGKNSNQKKSSEPDGAAISTLTDEELMEMIKKSGGAFELSSKDGKKIH